ncbi:MAG: hypothetical protein PHZ00_01250 [Candidatus Peribacteraceae bacterium]|nr:hypothetical protein [Candidatus Peribacteraceae bacterium]
MSLSDTSIGSFRELWKQEYGTELTDTEAREFSERFLGLVQLVIEPELHQIEKRKPP